MREMPKTKLSAAALKSLHAIDGKRTEYFDEELPGFSVRVAPSGRKSFCVLYRYRGRRLRRLTLGPYPVLSLSQARGLARAALAEALLGKDPAARKVERRCAETFAELSALYLERHARPNKRSWREDERRIQKLLLPRWGPLAAREIRRADVIALLDELMDRPAPAEAGQTHALVRKMFNWALSRDLLERNPCQGLPRPARAKRRDHVLTEEDIRKFWAAASEEKPTIAAALRLLLLTAQRGNEVLGMRWENVELATGWWTLPGERTKNRLSHRVPLAPQAVEILVALPKTSPWVFPGPNDSPIPSMQPAIQRVRRRAGIELRGHDLRRTAASFMASMGVPRLVVAKVLNHVETGVTAVYDRYSYDKEKRDALEAWAHKLREIIDVYDNTQIKVYSE